jgi:hypothetical protein
MTHVCTLKANDHIEDINKLFHDASATGDTTAYHKAFDTYIDELDRLAKTAFEWASKHGCARINIESHDSYAGDYWLIMTVYLDRAPGLLCVRSGESHVIPTSDADELADWLCYIDGEITVTATENDKRTIV